MELDLISESRLVTSVTATTPSRHSSRPRVWLRRPVVGLFGIVLLALLMWFVAKLGAYWVFSGNRSAVIQIMGTLRKGMPREEVMAILKPHESRFFIATKSSDGCLWWTQVGLVRAWILSVQFASDGTLETAKVGTEDGPYHPAGVPPDIK